MVLKELNKLNLFPTVYNSEKSGQNLAPEFVGCVHYNNGFKWTFQSRFEPDTEKKEENNIALHVNQKLKYHYKIVIEDVNYCELYAMDTASQQVGW